MEQECYYCLDPRQDDKWWINHRDDGLIIGRLCRKCWRHLYEYRETAIKEGRKLDTGSRRRIANPDIKRECYYCETTISIDKRGHQDWIFNYDLNNSYYVLNMLCHTCYLHILKNPVYTAKERPANPFRHYMKTEDGKFKEVKKEIQIRTGRCSLCPNNIFDGSCRKTDIHHWVYDQDHTLDYTQELCVSCHTRISRKGKRSKV